jgi:hypothetical protein
MAVEEAIDITVPRSVQRHSTYTPTNGISMKAWISFRGLQLAVILLRSLVSSASTFPCQSCSCPDCRPLGERSSPIPRLNPSHGTIGTNKRPRVEGFAGFANEKYEGPLKLDNELRPQLAAKRSHLPPGTNRLVRGGRIWLCLLRLAPISGATGNCSA